MTSDPGTGVDAGQISVISDFSKAPIRTCGNRRAGLTPPAPPAPDRGDRTAHAVARRRRGAGLGHRARQIRQRQRAVEGRLRKAIDNCMPIGKALAVRLAIPLHHGGGLHHRRRGLRLLDETALDHVQPSLDPNPLDGIARREQPPPPQPGQRPQAATAPAARDGQPERQRRATPLGPVHPDDRHFEKPRRQRRQNIIEPVGLRFAACVRLLSGVGRGQRALRAPDRILVTHPLRHQPSDIAKQGRADGASPDKPMQPIQIKLRVTGALIIDQPRYRVADDRPDRRREVIRHHRRRTIVDAEDIGQQKTE